MTNLIEVTKPKRGRKSKKDIIAASAAAEAAANENKDFNAIDIKIDENLETPKINFRKFFKPNLCIDFVSLN
jgi:hypothetical protein